MRSFFLCGVAATVALAGIPAHAATIVLIDQGGVTGSAAEQGFNIAAGYWASTLSNNVTIRLGVKYAALAPNVIGSTRSYSSDISVAKWEQLVNATKSNSAIDTNIVLPSLNGAGGASFIQSGTTATTPAVDTSVGAQVVNIGTTVSSKILYENNAVIKAIGGTVASDPINNPGGLDGAVTFSSTFGFDFNPLDGISANTFDFIGVAIHEIGHALGFVSGVDFVDLFGAKGPYNGLAYDLNSTSVFSALDMFRYSTDPNNKVAGNDPVLDLSVGTASYFSVDGGKTPLFGDSLFSTGSYNGDGRQASHWKDTPNCAIGYGIMDPTFCFGQMGSITGRDLAAFDAIGWNLTTPATSTYLRSTAEIYAAAVPEPATWAMMIFGFGLVGAALRRRPHVTAVTYG